MVEREVVLTVYGLKKLEDELEFLKTVRRKEIAEKIKHSITFGDISENSEYDEAKNEQAQVENRISRLDAMLRRATIIDEDNINTDIVSIGSRVQVKDLEFDEIVEYMIVGSVEADPYELKISNESPVGKSLIGSKVGDVVEIQIPDGVTRYEILQITR